MPMWSNLEPTGGCPSTALALSMAKNCADREKGKGEEEDKEDECRAICAWLTRGGESQKKTSEENSKTKKGDEETACAAMKIRKDD